MFVAMTGNPGWSLVLLSWLASTCVITEGTSDVHGELETLRYVAVVSRHGSRAPINTYPTDPYPYTNTTFWPKGGGELTNYGKDQLYHTGRALRAKYNSFVPLIYYPNDTIAMYNPYDRDFDSAACFLAGFYPPEGNEVWNKKIFWQPIPMAVRDFDICDVYKSCPAFEKEMNSQLAHLDANSTHFKNLLDQLTKYTGENVTKLTQIYDIYDTLLMQNQNGYILPPWTKGIFPTKMQEIAIEYLLLSYAGSDKLIRLGAGPELKFISNLLTDKAHNSTVSPNNVFYFEAAHDCTLISLLYAMGYEDPNLEIRTAAYVTYELHEKNSQHYVKIFYHKTNSETKPKQITLPGCKTNCPLDEFNQFVNKINPTNWQQECKI